MPRGARLGAVAGGGGIGRYPVVMGQWKRTMVGGGGRDCSWRWKMSIW